MAARFYGVVFNSRTTSTDEPSFVVVCNINKADLKMMSELAHYSSDKLQVRIVTCVAVNNVRMIRKVAI